MENDQPVRMALIATYPELSKLFLNIIGARDDIAAIDEFACFEDAVEVARRIEGETDVILSRGGTAEFIRRNVQIPVVLIPITPFDIVMAMQRFEPGIRDIALSYFKAPIYGLQEIQKMYGVAIHEYTFEDRKGIEDNARRIKERGITHLLGGEIAVGIAEPYGIKGINLSAGLDTLNRAINEAVSIVREARKERNRTARLAAAFNSITSGLILTDEENRVLVCNPAAGKIFGRQYTVGERLDEDRAGSELGQALQSRTPRTNYIRKVRDEAINTSHLPVILDGAFIGFVHTFENVTKIQNLEQTIRKQLHDKGFVAKYRFADIITRDPALIMVKKNAECYAQSASAILIEGESGTGKELFAQSLHNASPRAGGPFVAVNCAAIPANLLESELFGYEAGAFTGAKKEGRQGLFEIAHKGTIFLDEIGDLPKEFQARLLRVLQEKELMRVGGSRVTPVDVRIISATNKNLRELAQQGSFREDLYYRLSVFSLTIPPLRDRICDVEPLCRKFLAAMGAALPEEMFARVLPQLTAYSWPGNVRELQNITERLSHLLPRGGQHAADQENLALDLGRVVKRNGLCVHVNVEERGTLKNMVDQVEWQIIDHLLKTHEKNYTLVADRLHIGRTTLWRKYTRGA